jgi:CBS domain-containing protein
MVGDVPVMVVMQKPVIVAGNVSAYDVIKLMDNEDLPCVLVISEKLGIGRIKVFNRGSIWKLILKKVSPKDVKVEDFSSDDYIIVSVDTPIDKALELMRKHKVGTVLVVDNRRIVGVVTYKEVISITPDIISSLKELIDYLLQIINRELMTVKLF